MCELFMLLFFFLALDGFIVTTYKLQKGLTQKQGCKKGLSETLDE